MYRIRSIEEKIADLYGEQEMRCPVHLCIGQEAICAGVGNAIQQTDLMLSNHRAHGHYLAKGGDAFRMFAELYGKEAGCTKGRGGSMHLVDLSVNFLGSTPIVANIIPVATGVAFAEKMKGKKTVTVVFLGEAAIEEGAFHESLNFAVLKSLPILYVCENNLYSVYTPLADRQPKRSIMKLAAAHGASSYTADGNDVLEVYNCSQRVVDEIRSGRGPAFLEFPTYRHLEHCGPNFDNHIGYRTEKEYLMWKEKDPLTRFKRFAKHKQLLEFDTLEKNIDREIDKIVTKAKSSPLSQTTVTEDQVYAPIL